MQRVMLRPFFHRGKACLGIYAEVSYTLKGLLRKIPECRWSKTHQCWYIPDEASCREPLLRVLQGMEVVMAGKEPGAGASVTQGPKKVLPVKPTKQSERRPGRSGGQVFKGEQVAAVNAHVMKDMQQRLQLKAYSASTARTYLAEMAHLLKTVGNVPADSLTPDQLRRYLVYCFEKLGVKENTLHSRINALKFYYEQVLKREKFFWEIPRPKKPVLLPRFFSQEEIAAIIKAAGNLKHRTMLMLAYATGMRVSEVIALRTMDIDSSRMCILIRCAKGKKDRMVTLSPVLLVMLRAYWIEYKPPRDGYLFQGQDKTGPYSSRSLQLVLAAAKEKAGIMKPGSIHALRHSFATHLLDKGTDVTMIMKLLGHNDLKTTLRYLHVTNRDMLQVISPLDGLDLT